NILVSKSTNGGSSFAPPIIAYQQPNGGAGPDKNWLVVNNFSGTTKANRLLLAFQLESAASPIYRTYSDDGGTTWSSAANVTATSTLCDGAIPLYLSNGKTAIVYLNQGSNYPTTFRLEVAVSSDGGTTFGTPTAIVTAPMYQLPFLRSQKGKPGAAVDRTTGNIYVTYTALLNGSPK